MSEVPSIVPKFNRKEESILFWYLKVMMLPVTNYTNRTQSVVKARITYLKKDADLMRRVYVELVNEYQEKAERRMHRGATPLPHVILPDNGIIL